MKVATLLPPLTWRKSFAFLRKPDRAHIPVRISCHTLRMDIRYHHTPLSPRMTVLITHGYAEHSGRYQPLIKAFLDAGYDVASYDLRQHGTAYDTARPQACVDVAQLIDDHLAVRAAVSQNMRTHSLALLGHSMGGVITAASAQKDPSGISAVMLSAPALRQFPAVPLPLAKALRLLATAIPNLPTVKLSSADISHDPAIVSDYDSDPLNYRGPVPLLTAASLAITGTQVLHHSWPAHVPLFIAHGTADKLADIRGSETLANLAHTQLITVDGAFHEIFNEPEAPELSKTMLNWLEQQV
ncbi:Alpha/beta fold family hydrolase [Corynebacterium pseudotuberculosis]|uniref:alpha/beta fold hydrolase n=1 Tax=Corynebacterium pseudotuberculosis TaxID=1719 RepID=UPI0001DD4492|nr:alpha/beta fold hydrolase [Corynebacterium pseudotuberculosis]ADL21642.1 alpha/beta hydrolase [Corynebacterium pseudotuberculosis 1002]AJC14508.1 Hydrolase, alpha/beta fold family [Corynebacterium pseudotuberculosis]AKJ56451.1 Hydrolase, alpha/beta fold family [Corynebacterium pseudotuberculosis]ALM77440.1 alpha/beta fold family hydrolase [Corynebacterium pseudotuberculosis]ANK57126.1 Hydrolase, alpha/beta fold family [Corynebacterium pseudotuberculosis]